MCIVFIFHTLFPLVSEKTCFHLECLYWIEVIWTRSLLTFCFLRSVITFLNQMSLDCIWRVSQSQKCVSGRIIQTHKNWTCRVGTAEQTPQSSGRVCKCYRSVERITWDLLFEGIVDLNCTKMYLFLSGASEPRNMAYMNRLGIWGAKTPFREFGNFIQAVERR